MGQARFLKGSEEWEIFMGFWNLCQEYWIPEEMDSWWDEALSEIDAFSKKNGSTVFVRGLCLALINYLEEKILEQKSAEDDKWD